MRRREFIGHLSVIGAAAASTLFGRGSSAQSVPKRPLIAWVGAAPPAVKTPQFIVDLSFGNFVKGLLEFGYEQGRNIDIIRRTDIFRDRVPSIEEMTSSLRVQRWKPSLPERQHRQYRLSVPRLPTRFISA
jgi:putative ABC transport system substrate-binding protein